MSPHDDESRLFSVSSFRDARIFFSDISAYSLFFHVTLYPWLHEQGRILCMISWKSEVTSLLKTDADV